MRRMVYQESVSYAMLLLIQVSFGFFRFGGFGGCPKRVLVLKFKYDRNILEQRGCTWSRFVGHLLQMDCTVKMIKTWICIDRGEAMNRFFEELSMNAWPSIENHFYDGWILRYSNRYTKRANSVYPIYKSQRDMKEKLAFCEAFYTGKNMLATFRLHDGEELHDLDIFLEDNGYHVLSPTDVLSMSLENTYEVDRAYRVSVGYSQEWSDWYADAILDNPEYEREVLVRQTLNKMLQSIEPKSLYVFIEDDGEVVAVGNGVLEAGWFGIYNVVVQESFRGKGFGKAVMNALLSEGMKLGAKNSYLQVVCNNEAAMNLFLSIGYKKEYRYWYRRKKQQDIYKN